MIFQSLDFSVHLTPHPPLWVHAYDLVKISVYLTSQHIPHKLEFINTFALTQPHTRKYSSSNHVHTNKHAQQKQTHTQALPNSPANLHIHLYIVHSHSNTYTQANAKYQIKIIIKATFRAFPKGIFR